RRCCSPSHSCCDFFSASSSSRIICLSRAGSSGKGGGVAGVAAAVDGSMTTSVLMLVRRARTPKCSRKMQGKEKEFRRSDTSMSLRSGRWSLIALVPFDVPQINAVEQHGQFRRPQHQPVIAHHRTLAIRRRQNEASFLKPLIKKSVAVLVPPQQLHAVAAPRTKHEQVARQWILVQVRLHQRRQRIETFPHIGRQRADEDAARQRQAQHDGASNTAKSWRSASASKPARTRNTRPRASTTSNAKADDAAVAIITGRKAGAAVVEDCGAAGDDFVRGTRS